MKKLILNYDFTQYKEIITYDPVCSDNQIHIRFKDYSNVKMIKGFEQKLTFLLTYLATKSINIYSSKDYTSVDKELKSDDYISFIWDKYTLLLKNTCAYSTILDEIRRKLINFELDIKFSPLYRRNKKVSTWEQFGVVDKQLCYNYQSLDVTNLTFFLNKLGITLENYLFNDGYYITFVSDSVDDIYHKFNNKALRKTLTKLNTNKIVEKDLW